jgi:mannitol/fructose-specific phosphotransferase system IIA component (Ntr-type)
MGILLSEIFDLRTIKLNLEGATKEAAFNELSDAITAVHPECDQTLMLAALWERENKMSTGITSGIAVPHAICKGINSIAGAIGISQTGIEYGALDNEPVYVIFMLAMSEPARENHLFVLNQIARLAQSKMFASIKDADNVQQVYDILSRFD